MADKKINIDAEKIHLEFVEEVAVEMDNFEKNDIKNNTVGTEIAHISGYNIEDKKYLIGLMVVFTIKTDKDPIEFMFRYYFHFRIENYEEMYKVDEEGNPSFYKLFVATLAGISYSTLRGIIIEKTTKQALIRLTLPVINPSLILDSWIKQN